MQHLTNIRYRFNDGDFIKNMAYPEVEFTEELRQVKPCYLFNQMFTKREAFDEAFKKIIWISYRRNFPPLF